MKQEPRIVFPTLRVHAWPDYFLIGRRNCITMVLTWIRKSSWLAQPLLAWCCLFGGCWCGTALGQGDPPARSEEAGLLVLGPTEEYSGSSGFSEETDRSIYQSADGALAEDPYSTPYAARDIYRSEQGFGWQLMPQGLIYRQYLAGVKESRFRGVWSSGKGEGNLLDASLGGQVGLLRYGSFGNGKPVGWQLGIEGAGQIRLDVDQDADVDAADFRIGVPLTWGDEITQVKFAYYHLSSHVGDEYLLKHPGFPRLNYSRNVLVLGYSIYPSELWRVYAEIGYAVSSDVSQQWETQFGIDYAPNGATGFRGAPFAAVNSHLRQEVDYGGNFVFQAGWAWRRSPASGMFRVGVEYYNGKSDQYSFYNISEQKVGFGIWYDY